MCAQYDKYGSQSRYQASVHPTSSIPSHPPLHSATHPSNASRAPPCPSSPLPGTLSLPTHVLCPLPPLHPHPLHTQVLSNPELREKYDKYGSQSLNVDFVDPGTIFGMLFGSELFEPLVGEFAMAAAAKAGGDISEAELKHAQEVRRGLGL